MYDRSTRHDEALEEETPGMSYEDVVSAQWPYGHRRDTLQSPEKRLMLAVLEDAAAAVGRNAGRNTDPEREAVREAEEWCWSEDRSWPFSFLNVCDVLGFDPSCMRVAFARIRSAAAGPNATGGVVRIRRPLGTRTRVVDRSRSHCRR
jgi:hypothetical protein